MTFLLKAGDATFVRAGAAQENLLWLDWGLLERLIESGDQNTLLRRLTGSQQLPRY
jgi:hypothetical protein